MPFGNGPTRHIDEVIRVAEENPDFRWTIESVWQVNEWLKRQKKPSSVLPPDKEKIARLMNLIKVRPHCFVHRVGQHAYGFYGYAKSLIGSTTIM